MPKTLVRSARRPVNMKFDSRTSFCTSRAMLSTVPGLDSPRAALRSENAPYASLMAEAMELSVKADSVDEKSAMAVKLCCKGTVDQIGCARGMTGCKRQGCPRRKKAQSKQSREKENAGYRVNCTAGGGPRIYNSDSWMMLDESSASADENWSLGIVLLSPSCVLHCLHPPRPFAKLRRLKTRANPLWSCPSMTSTDLAAPALLGFRCYFQAFVGDSAC